MNNREKLIVLKSEITELKKKLDEILDTSSINSSQVIKLSKELDSLILNYYNSKR